MTMVLRNGLKNIVGIDWRIWRRVQGVALASGS